MLADEALNSIKADLATDLVKKLILAEEPVVKGSPDSVQTLTMPVGLTFLNSENNYFSYNWREKK